MDTCAIRVPVLPKLLSVILVNAFYCDLTWVEGKSVKLQGQLTTQIGLKPAGADEEITITHATLTEAIQKILDGEVAVDQSARENLWAAISANDFVVLDTRTCVLAVQVSMFGEVRHG